MQLARAGVIENVFALCYGFPQGGSMLLGGWQDKHRAVTGIWYAVEANTLHWLHACGGK